MAINPRLKKMLDENGAHYELLPHREGFTAHVVALSSHIPERKLAKVVVFRDRAGTDLMVVVPAMHHIDDSILSHVTGYAGIRLESETELRKLFPDCEVGAMPPFGKLYGLRMFVDTCFAREEDIWFQAGNHHELVHMSFADFDRLAGPFSMRACLHKEMVATRR